MSPRPVADPVPSTGTLAAPRRRRPGRSRRAGPLRWAACPSRTRRCSALPATAHDRPGPRRHAPGAAARPAVSRSTTSEAKGGSPEGCDWTWYVLVTCAYGLLNRSPNGKRSRRLADIRDTTILVSVQRNGGRTATRSGGQARGFRQAGRCRAVERHLTVWRARSHPGGTAGPPSGRAR